MLGLGHAVIWGSDRRCSTVKCARMFSLRISGLCLPLRATLGGVRSNIGNRMRIFSRLISGIWLLVPVSALGFLVWVGAVHVQRIDHLSRGVEATDVIDPASPTGYANRQRELILPQRNEDSFHWIAQTQQMFARGEWRVRHTDYDNAPAGRAVHQASPYRWWLGTVAWVDHLISGRPIGLSIERAAVVAEPILHGLFLIGATAFVAWRFGRFAAGLVSLGLAGIFPFAASFFPGIPDDHGLARIGALSGVLVLLAGVNSTAAGTKSAQRPRTSPAARYWFCVAGVLGGLGMWVSVSIGVPVIAGICLGALLAAGIARQQAKAAPDQAITPALWRAWGISGGATVMAAFLVEYPPAQLLSWRLESVHPLYAVAWIGAAELLARLTNWIQLGRRSSGWRDAGAIVLGVLAVAGVPVVMKLTDGQGFLTRDLLSSRLTNQPDGMVAANLWDWLVRDGCSARVVATLLPLLALVPASWSLCRKTTPLTTRVSLAIAVAPVLISLGFACLQLGWWSSLGALLLALVVAAASERPIRHRSLQWVWSATVAAFLIPGAMQLLPAPPTQDGDKLASHEAELLLERDEAELLVERDLAHWLAKHAGEEESPVVYAPPRVTTTLCFYGGLRGIGTLSPGNREGMEATIAIAAATTIREAQVLLEGRQVRYIVVPSWDPFFDEYARLYLAKSFSNWEGIFIPSLRQWNLPAWLRPLPYQIPGIGGFEKQSVLVFEVVDEQNPAVAMSRLAECLIEIGETEKAAAAGEALRRYPWDVGALAARAQVASECGDQAGLSQALESLHTRLSSGADRFLPWDRRVSLAIVLARAKRADLARKQVERCLADLDAKKLRSLSTGSLHVLLRLCNDFDLEIADRALRQLALSLLPPDLRQHH